MRSSPKIYSSAKEIFYDFYFNLFDDNLTLSLLLLTLSELLRNVLFTEKKECGVITSKYISRSFFWIDDVQNVKAIVVNGAKYLQKLPFFWIPLPTHFCEIIKMEKKKRTQQINEARFDIQ